MRDFNVIKSIIFDYEYDENKHLFVSKINVYDTISCSSYFCYLVEIFSKGAKYDLFL